MKHTLLPYFFFILLSLTCLQVHAKVNEQVLTSQEIDTALERLVSTIDQHYIIDENRAALTRRIHRAINNGKFDNSFTFGRFKQNVEAMLTETSGDTNFELHWRAGMTGVAEKQAEPYPGRLQWQYLDGGIGYLAIEGDMFTHKWQAEWARSIRQLADSTALIIDLRHAGLTSLSLSQHFLDYFIPAGETITGVRFARNKHTRLVARVLADNPLDNQLPVYILTSPFTAGPWEFVAYTMKHQERATLLGMPTMGLGYLTKMVALSPHLNLKLAYAEFQHPITKDNWQDWGVLPHLKCDAKNALEAAQILIEQQINKASRQGKDAVSVLCNTADKSVKTI
ncbi:hypothetical protein HHX48_03865 [Salinimonas sp. HHU 13199]|uniref:Tail specific protease domain-containing protein n=1 Tax=Salinimonas profundi TaxID=2729140 RepID=A0ABR8LGN3_9ALTE|nr:S41 family peptidase [Salinimonas profundi]MBD3584872.1 hypothetical protein [Salinimonas profundi]